METRTARRRWMRRLAVLAIPAASLPVMLATGAQADQLGPCIEANPDSPTTCGSGVFGIAVCGGTAGTTGPTGGTNLGGLPSDATIQEGVAGTAGVDAVGTGIGGTSPDGHAIVWTGTGVHAGIGSTQGGAAECPE